jgi:predicted ATPase
MQGKKFLHSIRLKNLLSYGEEGISLDLEPLNVLIGPNASGKSNLIEAISLLAAAPRDLMRPIREGGGTSQDWLWKGAEELPIAEIDASVDYEQQPLSPDFLTYHLAFTVSEYRFRILREEIRIAPGKRSVLYRDESKVLIPKLAVGSEEHGIDSLFESSASRNKIDPQQSTLSQVKDPDFYPHLTYVGRQFDKIKLFRGWPLGRYGPVRKPQGVNLPDDFLLEDASNLGLVVNNLQNHLATKRLLLDKLKLFYEEVEDVRTSVQGGTIQIFFHERGLKWPVPAACLSDGTLHYLCLLAILLHPEPPPLICLEEPELGLHPDIIPTVAELLIEASQRTQLIVTTHSEMLVSALSGVPESVVVCERDNRGTSLRRLDPEKLAEWLERYRLGDLWAKGEIGGNRW